MLEAHDAMLRLVAHRALHTHQDNGCISPNSLLTISSVLTERTSALRVADKGSGFVFMLACGHVMLQSSYGVKTVRCASGPNFVCPSSCTLQEPNGAFHESWSVAGLWYKRIPIPKPWCQLKNTQQRIVSYRVPPNETYEMDRHTHAWDRETLIGCMSCWMRAALIT